MDHRTRLKLFDAVRAEQGALLEAVLWRLTGNRELFAEAFQESLIQVWRHVEKLQGVAGRSYLYRIAQSAASQAWRRRSVSTDDSLDDRIGLTERPDDQAGRRELTAMVRRAINDLPEQQRRALTMRYIEQKDYDVMAREMDCLEATLRSHVSKALVTLRKVLDLRKGEA